jgi:hypothetical protein
VLGFTPALAGAEGQGAPVTCPVDHSQLLSALDAAVGAVDSGFNNQMWAVVVNRDGVVCALAFSGAGRNSQWLLSRQIAAAKAFTANGLSLDIGASGSGPLSTAQLYPSCSPAGPFSVCRTEIHSTLKPPTPAMPKGSVRRMIR